MNRQKVWSEMEKLKFDPGKITKPTQLASVWFIALVAMDFLFLNAAVNMNSSLYMPIICVASAIGLSIGIPYAVFRMMTKYRRELGADEYYYKNLKQIDLLEELVNDKANSVISSVNDMIKSVEKDIKESGIELEQGGYLLNEEGGRILLEGKVNKIKEDLSDTRAAVKNYKVAFSKGFDDGFQ